MSPDYLPEEIDPDYARDTWLDDLWEDA